MYVVHLDVIQSILHIISNKHARCQTHTAHFFNILCIWMLDIVYICLYPANVASNSIQHIHLQPHVATSPEFQVPPCWQPGNVGPFGFFFFPENGPKRRPFGMRYPSWPVNKIHQLRGGWNTMKEMNRFKRTRGALNYRMISLKLLTPLEGYASYALPCKRH